MIFIYKKLNFYADYAILILLHILIMLMQGEYYLFGKNVFSSPCVSKMCSNIGRCIFRCASQWGAFFIQRWYYEFDFYKVYELRRTHSG